MTADPRSAHGEEAEGVMRAIFGLTAGVGLMAAVIAAAADQPPLIAVPTLVLIGCLCVSALGARAYAAAGVWLVLAPAAPGEAMLVPLAMILLCVAIAVGPDRLLAWVARDAAPEGGDGSAHEGWIEDVDGLIG